MAYSWNAWDAQSTQEFYEQVVPYIHPDALRPLMGVCAPTVIGLYSAPGGTLSLAMELPHPVGWHEADPYIHVELKEQVIVAYQNLHARNILHNDVKLENVLIGAFGFGYDFEGFLITSPLGDDGKVTIVDFCKMVVNAEPADLALEMRAIKFSLDYNGAKKTEYKRLRRAESRAERNRRRSRLRRKAKDKGLTNEVEPDEPPSQDEIDVSAPIIRGLHLLTSRPQCPPFSRLYLKMWDSEVCSEGTTHCLEWLGRRFQVPEDMQIPPWPGAKDYTPPTPPPYQPIDFATLVKEAFRGAPFGSHDQWMKPCRYFPSLWSPPPDSAVSDDEEPTGSSSSTSTSSGPSDYGSCSEDSPVTDAEPSKRDHSTPSPSRNRPRAEDFSCPDDCTHQNKRQLGLKSSESQYEVYPASWITRQIKGPDTSPSLSESKGGGRETPPLVTPPQGSSSEAGLPTLADLSPTPRKPVRRATRSLTATSVNSGRPPPAHSISSSRRGYRLQRKSERKCSVIVKDDDGEDQVWVMSKEALQDVRSYLQVKRATGAAMEVRSGGGEGNLRLRTERILRTAPSRPTRKRTSPEDCGRENQNQKRRRSWPDTNLYAFDSLTGSLPSDG